MSHGAISMMISRFNLNDTTEPNHCHTPNSSGNRGHGNLSDPMPQTVLVNPSPFVPVVKAKSAHARLRETAIELVRPQTDGTPTYRCPSLARGMSSCLESTLSDLHDHGAAHSTTTMDVELRLDSIQCIMGCMASFPTRDAHLQHLVTYQCPKRCDLGAQMLIPAPVTSHTLYPLPNLVSRFDVLRHVPDRSPENIKRLSYRKDTSSLEISSHLADRARSYCVTNSYDPGQYCDNSFGFVAIIEDITAADSDAHFFPGSSKLSVDSSHTTAFENHGRATNFRGTSRGMEDIELQRHSATDVAEIQDFSHYHKALAAGAIAFFKCPVPGCERVFSPTTEISQFYNHLEEAVHWVYFDANGPVQCELGCGRAFINHMSFNKHIRNGRCIVAAAPSAPPDTDTFYDCAICSITFSSRTKFVDHFIPPEGRTRRKLSQHA